LVIHFAINLQAAATDCLSPYNKAVLISKVSEEVAMHQYYSRKLSLSTTPLSFDAPYQRNPV